MPILLQATLSALQILLPSLLAIALSQDPISCY